MYVVEIRRRRADLASAMTQMRTWLDHNHAQPALFELVFLRESEIGFFYQFEDRNISWDFAADFGGEVLSGPRELAA